MFVPNLTNEQIALSSELLHILYMDPLRITLVNTFGSAGIPSKQLIDNK